MNKLVKQIIESKFNFNIDIEDNENKSSLSKSSFNSKSLKQMYEIELYTVDLGLPSGTRWCKYNLGVDPNYLSSSNLWYGKSFAWGEVKAKYDEYLWDNYKYCNKSLLSLTKYCPRGEKYLWAWDWSDSNVKRTPPDGKLILEESDDAANVTNELWKTPSEKDFEELLEYTTGKQMAEYNDIIGLNGWEFTSNINDNKIFFPMIRENNQICAYYWTNKIYKSTPYEAITFYIDDFVEPRINSSNRCFGHFIRPILKK